MSMLTLIRDDKGDKAILGKLYRNVTEFIIIDEHRQ